jgi:hypothetical protein
MNFRKRIIRGDCAKPSAFDPMADIFVSYAKTDRAFEGQEGPTEISQPIR